MAIQVLRSRSFGGVVDLTMLAFAKGIQASAILVDLFHADVRLC